MTTDTISALATALRTARLTRAPIEPIRVTHPDLTVDDAYAVQRVNLDRDLAEGATLVGHKIGLTARAMQELLGVDEPDYGYLLDSMVHPSGVSLAARSYLAARAEPEIAFRLHAPLSGPGVTAADVMAATEALAPSLEIVDSRVRDWDIKLIDTIADNASSAAAVVGDWVPLAGAPAPTEVACTLTHNGEVAGKGVGTDVVGDPAEALAWLANALGRFGVALEPGQLLLPGSLTTAVFVHPGDEVTADFGALGTVTVHVH